MEKLQRLVLIFTFSQLQKSLFELCGGGSHMVGILPRMKEKQADLLCSQGGIFVFFQQGTLALTK